MKRTSLRSSRLLFALSAVSLLLAVVPLCFAGIADDVHAVVVQHRLDWAEGALKTYLVQHAQTPEYLDALSWLARGYSNGNQSAPVCRKISISSASADSLRPR